MSFTVTGDRFRVVERNHPAGRPVVVLDLEDGDGYSKIRGSFQLVAGEKAQRVSQSSRRYGGGWQAGEAQGNARVGATWMVMGTDEDDCLHRAEAFVAQVDDAARGRWVEWRPHGVSVSSFLEIRGSGVWTPLYDQTDLVQLQAVRVEASWPRAPWVAGDPMDIWDDFAVDSVDDYTFDQVT